MMKLAIVFIPIFFAVIWMLFIGLRINKRDENRNDITEAICGYLKIKESGELTQAGFDSLIYDLTNFLVYVGEPAKRDRERIGWYVIFFFITFTALSFLLYREYQKDYH